MAQRSDPGPAKLALLLVVSQYARRGDEMRSFICLATLGGFEMSDLNASRVYLGLLALTLSAMGLIVAAEFASKRIGRYVFIGCMVTSISIAVALDYFVPPRSPDSRKVAVHPSTTER